MGNLLRKGARWLSQQRTRHASEVVLYIRAGFQPLQIKASYGRNDREIFESSDMQTVVSECDFLALARDLVLNPSAAPGQSSVPVTTLPAQGDRIQVGRDGEQDLNVKYSVYEVQSPNGSEPPWRYADEFRYELRIHTKFIGIGPPLPT
jgi:hypothetical protein